MCEVAMPAGHGEWRTEAGLRGENCELSRVVFGENRDGSTENA